MAPKFNNNAIIAIYLPGLYAVNIAGYASMTLILPRKENAGLTKMIDDRLVFVVVLFDLKRRKYHFIDMM